MAEVSMYGEHLENCIDPERCWCEAKRYAPILWIGLLLFAVQFIGGRYAGSLAVVADAFHVFTDNISVLNALLVVCVVRLCRERAPVFTIRRVGARIQAMLIVGVALWIAFEAFERFASLSAVRSSALMICIAAFGAAGNWYMHILLRWKEGNLTAIALDRHILGDLAQSGAVFAGGIVIALTGVTWIDPALSLLVASAMGYWGVRTYVETLL